VLSGLSLLVTGRILDSLLRLARCYSIILTGAPLNAILWVEICAVGNLSENGLQG
jgi:hypothetical protein